MAKSFDDLAARTMSTSARARAARRTKTMLAELVLSEIRKQSGVSQRRLAETLGIKQPSLSKLEGQHDMQVSTLRKIIQALGGEMLIIARFAQREVRITQFDRLPEETKRPRSRKAA